MAYRTQGSVSDRTDRYWASVGGDELAGELRARIGAYYHFCDASGRIALWRSSVRAFFGHDETGGWKNASCVKAAGQEGELVYVKSNQFGSILQNAISIITASRPAIRGRAQNDTPEATEATILVENLTDYDLHHYRLEEAFRKTCERGWTWGEGWIFQYWDPTAGKPVGVAPGMERLITSGDIVTKTLTPIDVVRDVGARLDGDNALQWVIVRVPMNKWDLVAQYPMYRDEILGANPVFKPEEEAAEIFRTPLSSGFTDQVYGWFFHHKRTPALPTGRSAFMVGQTVLYAREMEYADLPAHVMFPLTEERGAFGYSPAWDLLGLQTMYDSTLSTAATNHEAGGVQNFWTPPGEVIETEELGGGLRHLRSAIKPESLQMTDTSEHTYRLREMMKEDMEIRLGINSVQRGEPEENVKSGKYAALVQAMAVQFNSSTQAAYGRLQENVFSARIDIRRRFVKTEQTLEIVGNNEAYAVKKWTAESLASVSGVIVELADPTSQTSQGRRQLADTYAERQWITTPEQYAMVVATGRAEPIFRRDRDEMRLIARENEMMRNGEDPLGMESDRHSLHIREHSCVLSDPLIRYDPVKVKTTLEHISWHKNMARTADPLVLAAVGEPVPPDHIGNQGLPPGPPQESGGAPSPDGPAPTDSPPKEPPVSVGGVDPGQLSSSLPSLPANPQMLPTGLAQ